jgi:hypothetical protein
MPDHSPSSEPTGTTHAGPGGSSPPRTPRWVWASLVLVGVLVAVAVVLLLVGGGEHGGEHGPGRHLPAGAAPAVAGAVAAAGPTALAGARR